MLCRLLRFCVFGNEAVKVSAAQSFDVVTHGDATGTSVTPLFGNTEAEIVAIALVGRDAHLEDSNAFGTLVIDFVIVVSIFNLFEALLLVKLNFVGNRSV